MTLANNKTPQPKPEWLRKRLPLNTSLYPVGKGLRERRLHTICEEGLCPNIGECFSKNVATLLIMGKVCTRNCSFCGVTRGTPTSLNKDEPGKVAEEVKELGLRFVVVTSVTRDDLPDGGASHFAEVTTAIKEKCSGVGIELLVPDFKGSFDSLDIVLEAQPEVLSHNIETAKSFYESVRPQADYARSLKILEHASMNYKIIAKSGFMVGLGETRKEISGVMSDLRNAGCEMLTIGQYLSPSKKHYPVRDYIRPEVYKEYEIEAKELGFLSVAASPFVRSSYLAENFYDEVLKNRSNNG